MSAPATHDCKEPIAIVGMAGRFPGAASVAALWDVLVGRGDAIRAVPAERWDRAARLDPERTVQGVGGFVDGVEQFDPTFFGISPREAVDIDPQQRLMLEVTWQALEDAGRPAAGLRGSRTGVYVGASWHDYELVRSQRGALATQHSGVGSALDAIAARVSYFLGLRGPSLVVETGCSSSLVALHLACQALRSGELDGALVGGVNLILAPDVSVALTRFGALSPEGRCQAFAAGADGFVRGEGAIAVYVKRLSRALADGDRIHAVIAGSAVNNDGGGDSLVTPSPAGQDDLLARAYGDAGVAADDVVYVEAHGTGTPVGDPIEAGALGRALGQRRSAARGPLAVGSIKTNIGHLEAAAGLAGLVKAVLALEHRLVPPNLHGDALNPAIDFAALQLCVVREALALPADGAIYAGVNSFGWGGTNAHVVLGSAPAAAAPAVAAAPVGPVVVPVSAHSEAALRQRARDIADIASAGASLEAIAGTLAWQRDQFRCRAAAVANDAAELAAKLAAFAGDAAESNSAAHARGGAESNGAVGAHVGAQINGAQRAGGAEIDSAARAHVGVGNSGAARARGGAKSNGTSDTRGEIAFGTEVAGWISGTARAHGRTAFVFPGQGAQWIGMGRALLTASPRFAAVIERCAAALAPHVEWDLVACLAGEAGDRASRVDVVQPVLWAMSVALAELWREAGIEPDVVIGHSQGEIAAATVAGALSYEDAARIVAVRSRIVRRVSGRGAMLAVELDADAAAAALAGFEGQVGLAAHNGPRSCVLSGDAEAVALLHELLEAEGTFGRLVKVDYASHSHHMDELTGELVAALAGIAPAAARTQMVSSVDAAAVAGGALDATYWARNLRQPVRFAEAMARAFDDGVTHAIEISPHPVLAPAIEQLAAQRAEPPSILSTLRRDAGTPGDFAMALARAFAAGLAPFGGLPRRASLALPAYPWQRQAYWIAPSKRRPAAGAPDAALALVPTPGEADAWHGTMELALDDQPWLRDHKVHEAIALPGAAMLALALEAARARTDAQLMTAGSRSGSAHTNLDGALHGLRDGALHGLRDAELRAATLPTTAVVTLVGVRFQRDITLGEEPVRMSVAWRDEAAGGGSFALLSMAAGTTEWTEHATARVQRGAPVVAAAFPTELRAQAAIDAEPFYRSCAARGLHYGPAFQGVARVFVDGDAAVGEVRLPDACPSGARPGLHPALWDAALQVCLALCEDGITVVPSAVARVAVLRDLAEAPTVLWSHAVRRGADRFDVALFDAAEQPVMRMEGLTLTALPVAAAAQDADRLHRLQFHEQRCTSTEAAAPTWAWVVCGEAAHGATALVNAIKDGGIHRAADAVDAADAGGPCGAAEMTRARPARCEIEQGAAPGALAATGVRVALGVANAGDARNAHSAVGGFGGRARIAWPVRAENAAAWREALAAGEAPAGMVFVAPPASAGLEAQRRGLMALAALVTACTQLGSAPRLVVVTANGQAATDEDCPDPGAAMYVAMARVAGREHPELQVRSVDVDAAEATRATDAARATDVAQATGTGDAEWALACAAELAAGDCEDQVALRGGRRLVGRLVRGSIEREIERAIEREIEREIERQTEDGERESGGAAQRWTTPRQAFRLHAARPGLLDALEFRPLVRRAPAAGEIEVEVAAAALNFIDAMKAMGTYPGLATQRGEARLGGECAGRVVAVGAGVTGMQVGDRVVACGFGSFASHVTVRADHAQHIPSDLDDEAAAGLPLVLTTAWYGLHDLARLQPGETVLIHSAAGGLGLAAIQVARRLGARVIATAGSEAKRCYLRGRGIAHVFDSRDGSWVEGVRAATGGAGVDVVLNSLTGAAIGLGLDALAEDGRFIEVGKQDIHGGRSLRLDAFKKGISFAAVDLAGLMERRPERFARALAAAWTHVSSAAVRPLPTTAHRFADAADALRTLARGNHIGKLVLTAPGSVTSVAPEAMPDGRFRGDATYLITGGLGALGLSLAEFMAERGAAALALAGRSAPGAGAEPRIAALRARGVRVETLALDVADAAAVDRALTEIRRTMPALRGVIHAAGVLDDATLANLAPAQLARVLAPKIDGARHLDAATAGDALDVFAMFSSAAALVGNPGQAAYAAANAYLDALAVARRRRGRPGLSVQWGPFAEIGLAAADDARGARLAERGMGGFAAPEAWRAFADMLAGDARDAVVGYVPLDLRRWFDAYPATAALPSWQALRAASRRAGEATGGAASGAFRSQLEASPEAARRPLAEAKVRELAGRVLRLAPGGIDGETPFKALGLDSLMGLELRNRLESAFGLTLSPTLLWTYGNPRALAGALCERVFRAAA